MATKTHWRKAFDSPYLSSSDIVDPVGLTISYVLLEPDRTNKTKELFNTAYFVEKEIRPGEKLKPMILNVGNCKVLRELTKKHYIDDWRDVRVTVYVDTNVKFGRDMVEGLRLAAPAEKPILTPDNTEWWERAKTSFKETGNLKLVLLHCQMSPEHQEQLMSECKP